MFKIIKRTTNAVLFYLEYIQNINHYYILMKKL